MKLTNFRIASSIELELQGRLYDLHNFYRLHRASYSCNNRAEIEFRRDEAVRSEGPKVVLLAFENVDFIKIAGTLGNVCHLEDMGFKDEDDYDEDFVVDEQYKLPSSHFMLMFYPDFSVRVRSQEATASVS